MTVRSMQLVISADRREIARARTFVACCADLLRAEVSAADLAVVASELVANAVATDTGDVTVIVAPGPEQGLRLEVHDQSRSLPVLHDRPAWDTEGHRGLMIVGAMCADWGVDAAPGGKVVWAELAAVPAEDDVAAPAPEAAAERSTAGELDLR